MHTNGLKTRFAAVLVVFCAACASAPEPIRNNALQPIAVGPSRGTLIIAGGGQLGSDIVERFVEAAGGKRAKIVVIPTAGDLDIYPKSWTGLEPFKDAGAKSVTILHTREARVADSDAFAKPLREATGVWFPGGRQWRLADAYLNTKTLLELYKLLERGGVIGGTSAGASVQASYLVRGAREANTIVMAPGYEQGFGFLRGAAVDQHLSARNRQHDLLQVIARHQNLLGIGLDEGTAIVVRGDTAEVLGDERVAFYNTDRQKPDSYFWLKSGDRFDLNRRTVLIGNPVAGN
jgi:cyanophycinase